MASISPSPSISSSSSSKCSFVSYTDADNLTEPPHQLAPLVANSHSDSYPQSNLPGSPSSIGDGIDSMSTDELKTQLIDTKLRLKELEASLENYKLLVDDDKDQTRIMVEELRAQLGLEEGMFNANKYDLHSTCESLSKQRDQLVKEIQLLSRSKEGATYNAKPILDRAFDTQLQSMQKEITDSKRTIEQLKSIRDGILEEMVLLNTKNAELNTMNNDLSRHIAHRELETKALMASTQFLRPSTSSDTAPITSPSTSTSTSTSSSYSHLPPPDHTVHPNPSTSSSTCSSASSTKKQSKKQQKQTKKQQQQDQVSTGSDTKIFPFGRHKNVFANMQPKVLQRKKSNENPDQPTSNKQAIAVPLKYEVNDPSPSQEQQQVQQVVDQGKSKQQQKPIPTGDSLEEIRSISHHQFVETKFLRPIKCELCQEKMWRSNEWKCQACSVVCHVKCAPLMADQCKNAPTSQTKLPSLPMKQYQQTACFGRDLVTQAREEKRAIPFVVQFCVEAVNYRGLDFEGIYRKSGGASQMRLIQQYFDRKQYPNLRDSSSWDICSITSVLKHYFRELPNPLFPYEFYEALMQAFGDRIKNVGQVIKSMPKENYNTINYLMRHLDRVQQHSQKNLMVTKNLAMVFGPTLIRNIDEMHDITEMNQKIHVLDFILHHINELFDTSPPSSPLVP